jgi:cation:H+ antiporter
LVVGIAIILMACELFVNSIEWLGKKLNLGEGAVGSILAAVGTALPETMIPIIAILFGGGSEASHEIGIGAILGAPFMLSTAAFFVTGTAILIFTSRGRRTPLMKVNTTILGRDMRFFLIVYLIAVAAAFVSSREIKIGIGIFLIGLYGYYVLRTLGGDEGSGHAELNPLYFARQAPVPGLAIVLIQVAVALGMIIAGARFFVTNMEIVAAALGVSPLVMSLIIAPLATELPEKFNSVLWVREGKDTLAMGNISGAMVFQSCIPVAVGLMLTTWQLDQYAVASVVIALISTSVVFMQMRSKGHLTANILALSGLFYLAFIAFVLFAPQIGGAPAAH